MWHTGFGFAEPPPLVMPLPIMSEERRTLRDKCYKAVVDHVKVHGGFMVAQLFADLTQFSPALLTEMVEKRYLELHPKPDLDL